MFSRIFRPIHFKELIYSLIVSLTLVSSMDLFNVKLVEQNDSRLVATSNYNYAISSPKLAPKNWRTVSVNGDKFSMTLLSGERFDTTKSQLTEIDRLFIESLRDEIANSNNGFTHISSAVGSGGGGFSNGNIMMSSTSGGSSAASNSFSSSSTSSTGGGVTSVIQNGQHGTVQANGLNVNIRDDDNFSVSKSDLPYNWSRVFFNNDLVTIVYRSGDLDMRPMTSMEASQLEVITKLKLEVKTMQKKQMQQFSDTMQNSMNMVSSVFNNIMGTFPKPPSYESAVGNMFGNSFPFGPNNSPFSGSSGWPFGGGASGGVGGGEGGAGSFAFASARR